MRQLRRLRRFPCAGLVLVALLAVAGDPRAAVARPSTQPPRVNPDAQLSVEFQKRVQAYVDIHKKADSGLPEVPTTAPPDQVHAHQQALQKRISELRGTARQGEIFTQATRAYFRRQISRALSGPGGPAVRAAILEENPGRIQLRVNGAYPETVPILTMPPQVLAELPKLPEQLEFRFIGDRLILLDIHAQLVVDFMDDALP